MSMWEESGDKIVELKEENAKLKCLLSDAKAIIRKYYNYNHICGYSYEAIDKQAEQFLKEVYL